MSVKVMEYLFDQPQISTHSAVPMMARVGKSKSTKLTVSWKSIMLPIVLRSIDLSFE